jgi:flagellar basal-body rod protein FlgB
MVMNIFSVVSRNVNWLQQRHATTAANIANGDTPGYKAREVSAFTLGTVARPSQLATTNVRHISGSVAPSGEFETLLQRNIDVSHSGNDVMIEKELKSLGETSRAFAFDSSIAKIFHRMMMTSVKG